MFLWASCATKKKKIQVLNCMQKIFGTRIYIDLNSARSQLYCVTVRHVFLTMPLKTEKNLEQMFPAVSTVIENLKMVSILNALFS